MGADIGATTFDTGVAVGVSVPVAVGDSVGVGVLEGVESAHEFKVRAINIAKNKYLKFKSLR